MPNIFLTNFLKEANLFNKSFTESCQPLGNNSTLLKSNLYITENRLNDRVRISVSWFGKYNAFFIFHDTIFPAYSENRNTKEDFCFLNRGTKTKFFLTVKVKNDFNMMRISFLLKQLCCCCLEIKFFSLILVGVSFCNSFQLYVLFLSAYRYIQNYWKLF